MVKEYTGKTVEEAVAEGLKDLGITIDNAEYTIIEEAKKGTLFGIGAKDAKIAMSKKKTDAIRVAEFLEGLFETIKIKATTEIIEECDERIVINVITTDSSSLIGYRGEVLDSLQCFAGAVGNKNKANEQYRRIVVDCEGYRAKREATLKNLAEKLAEKAIKTSRKITLEPMNPFERRIIHASLMNVEGVKTVSEGKEPNRFIAIIPDDYDPSKDVKRSSGHNKKYKRNDEKFDHNGVKKQSGFNRDNDRRNGSKLNKNNSSFDKPKRSGFGGVFLGNSLKNKDNKTE